MGTLRRIIAGLRGFLAEVGVEMKKSTWPARSELMESTVVVIAWVLLLGMFVAASDWLLIRIIRVLIPAG